ncbi:MAG: glycosyl hydrolase [Chitinophagales bacterium]|nr:glycosyl hydrolase [Chitinophagales bacterium]
MTRSFILLITILMSFNHCTEVHSETSKDSAIEKKIDSIIKKMTLDEKAGQLHQIMGSFGTVTDDLRGQVKSGQIGSVLNEIDPKTILELQRIAVEESPNGIPILFARDVIHGFKTIFPIPLGQAASWNPLLIEECAHISAMEASSVGINWTFAPMMDVCRDPRWGRIAETLGEDPHLSSVLSSSMIKGYQGNDISEKGRIAACAKHFAGYGAAEGGRDYNTSLIPEAELHNIYLPPFKAAVENDVATFMTGFNDLNGVPVTANKYLTRDLLKNKWAFDGFVVSDWESISQLAVHGFTENQRESALKAFKAGVDMDMQSYSFLKHIPMLVKEGLIDQRSLDDAVRRILRVKFKLGLFDDPFFDPADFPEMVNDDYREKAKQLAIESCVLLKNDDQTLPLEASGISKLAVLGPLSDDPYEQLGTWIFDGDEKHSITPLQAIQEYANGNFEVNYLKVLETSRSVNKSSFNAAEELVINSDAVVMFLGEESILSGEAHSRARINLPGCQEELIDEISRMGKPLVVVIMAGRPISLENVVNKADAIIFAWHPGTMGGPAIADIVFGKVSPSGKLPVTFPKNSGQIPIYYNHKHTGKPPTKEKAVLIDDIPVKAKQWSVGNVAYYLDAGYEPMFPFGYGLSYTQFTYENLKLSKDVLTSKADELTVRVDLVNNGDFEATEISQLYIRDLVSSITRPVKELIAFQRHALKPGERKTIEFKILVEDLAYYYPEKSWSTENGNFDLWVGGDSRADLKTSFKVKK